MAGSFFSRRRFQLLGCPKGITKSAEQKARIAENLCEEGKYLIEQIARELHLSKTTFYKHLRKQGVNI